MLTTRHVHQYYDEDALRDWDEELLESLDKVVEAFSSEANLDAALEDGIFAGADESVYDKMLPMVILRC